MPDRAVFGPDEADLEAEAEQAAAAAEASQYRPVGHRVHCESGRAYPHHLPP